MIRKVSERINRFHWLVLVEYALFLIGTAISSYLLPYGNDDWQWGSAKRIQLMKRGFAGYNGRYIGNLLALAESRSHLVKMIILTTGLLVLLVTLVRFLKDGSSLFAVSVCIMAVLCVPNSIFRQTLGWAPGFVNFVPPAVLLVIYLQMTHPIWEGKADHCNSLRRTLGAFFLGLAAQLFAEHNTLMNLFYAAAFPAWTWLRDRKIYRIQGGWLAGCTLGAGLMFSNSAYMKAFYTSSDFKAIRFTFDFLISQVRDQMLPYIFVEKGLLNTAIAICLILLLHYSLRKKKRRYAYDVLLAVCAIFSVLYQLHILPRINGKTLLAGTVLWYGAIAAALIECRNACKMAPESDLGIPNRRSWEETMMLLLLSVVSVVPLAVATPIGSRCFYTHYVLQVCMGLLLLKNVTDEKELRNIRRGWHRVLAVGFAAAAALAGGYYFKGFVENGCTRIQRDVLIREAVAQKAEVLTLPKYPHRELIWMTDPSTERNEKLFRRFFGISKKTVLVFTDRLEERNEPS